MRKSELSFQEQVELSMMRTTITMWGILFLLVMFIVVSVLLFLRCFQ